MKQILLFLVACIMSFNLTAQISIDTVKVIQVHDGDSYAVKKKSGQTIWVRLAYVDCPEVVSPYVNAKQFYGDSATIKVREIIKGREMRMTYFKDDIFERQVVSLEAIGDNDFNLARLIISHGYGWFLHTSKIPKRFRLVDGKNMMKEARKAKRGLWAYPKPISPVKFRRLH